MQGAIQGGKCKAFLNTGTREAPVWAEIKGLRDVDRDDTRAKGDASSRDSDFASAIMGQRTITVTGLLVYSRTDTTQIALRTAFANNAVVDLCFLDAPGGVGSTGFRGDFLIEKIPRKEPVNDAVTGDFAAALTDIGGGTWAPYTMPEPD